MNGRMADDIPNCGWLIPTAGFREFFHAAPTFEGRFPK